MRVLEDVDTSFATKIIQEIEICSKLDVASKSTRKKNQPLHIHTPFSILPSMLLKTLIHPYQA